MKSLPLRREVFPKHIFNPHVHSRGEMLSFTSKFQRQHTSLAGITHGCLHIYASTPRLHSCSYSLHHQLPQHPSTTTLSNNIAFPTRLFKNTSTSNNSHFKMRLVREAYMQALKSPIIALTITSDTGVHQIPCALAFLALHSEYFAKILSKPGVLEDGQGSIQLQNVRKDVVECFVHWCYLVRKKDFTLDFH